MCFFYAYLNLDPPLRVALDKKRLLSVLQRNVKKNAHWFYFLWKSQCPPDRMKSLLGPLQAMSDKLIALSQTPMGQQGPDVGVCGETTPNINTTLKRIFLQRARSVISTSLQ